MTTRFNSIGDPTESELEHRLQVERAFNSGWVVEFRPKDLEMGSRWMPCTSPMWMWGVIEYRVAPGAEE